MPVNIFLFVPNIIGYFRIIFVLISFYYMTHNYVLASLFYCISALLDAFDGYAARLLNQATKFGSVLDQLTDRCATMCLIMTLSTFYPRYMFAFQMVNIIDIAGHWIHIWSSLMKGSQSHKIIDPSSNAILKIYYSSRPLLFFMCLGNEVFYTSLYLMYFTNGPIIMKHALIPLIVKITAPIALLKLIITVIQTFYACKSIGSIDTAEKTKECEKNG